MYLVIYLKKPPVGFPFFHWPMEVWPFSFNFGFWSGELIQNQVKNYVGVALGIFFNLMAHEDQRSEPGLNSHGWCWSQHDNNNNNINSLCFSQYSNNLLAPPHQDVVVVLVFCLHLNSVGRARLFQPFFFIHLTIIITTPSLSPSIFTTSSSSASSVEGQGIALTPWRLASSVIIIKNDIIIIFFYKPHLPFYSLSIFFSFYFSF